MPIVLLLLQVSYTLFAVSIETPSHDLLLPLAIAPLHPIMLLKIVTVVVSHIVIY